MTRIRTLPEMLDAASADAIALMTPTRPPLSYRDLADLVRKTAARLSGHGIGPGDPVAIVLPNGPEMAACFVATASVATAAPLNPAYREEEFSFYLEDLSARALIVADGSDTPARSAANALGIQVLELKADQDGPAGLFNLPEAPAGDGPVLFSKPDDIALVLHTSGTTSRPKIVPLSCRNITASAFNISESLALQPTDRCLNVMPLFHIHGLIAAVLSSLSAGASISCTSGFNALSFFGWMRSEQPSWYTAVPTMHQAILQRAGRNAETIRDIPLRLIRSSSASLPVPVLEALEETFGCPVIEAYGMTEAAHQMAANPLPPRMRKPGSVGIAAGPEVGIMDRVGTLLSIGETGEIVIRGENVTAGYQNNEKANLENFTNGWFRTGDQGVLDAEGYLTINGRLKEIINRGGEKIAPREVDDVLMTHPAVDQAVTFAIAHEKLGEDVAACIVL
ncbi:MAG: AMP-binding protein, partial [Pseudomonadota bacterium]